MGLSSGLVASPCLTPVIGSILVYLTTKKNLLYGTTLLLSFALGMGFLLILVGTFSAALVNLPKSGKWMLYIKRVLSFLLIGIGIYFICQGLKNIPSCFALEPDVQKEKLTVDFTLKDLNNNEISLSNYRDKQPVLLFFWATWCPYCRRELKVLNSRYALLTKEGWVVLAIDVGEPAYRVNNFIKNYALTFPVLLDKDTAIAELYDILGIPTYVVIDKEGDIVFKDNYFPQKYNELILK